MNESGAPRIRLARPDDAPGLPAVERSAGALFLQIPELAWIAGDVVQDEERHRELIGNGTEWVAVDGEDRPVGFLSADITGNALHIFELAVDTDHQRQGCGRALVSSAAEEAMRRGLAAVTLTTFRDVPWNAPFYGTLGFVILTPCELDKRLAAILAVEEAVGIPMERRCAMRLDLASQPQSGASRENRS